MSNNSQRHTTCKFCNGFYDFGSDQPVCCTCHAFVYEFARENLTDVNSSEEKEASNDSGNEEPERVSDFYPLENNDNNLPSSSTSFTAAFGLLNSRAPHKACPFRQQTHGNNTNAGNATVSSLSSSGSENVKFVHSFEQLPTEVLLWIFEYLDDVSIWGLRLASRRCCSIIDNEVPDQRWATFVAHRWPMFASRHKTASWRLLYLNMMDSVTCRLCLSRLRSPCLFSVEGPGVRFRRIVSEIKSLCADPPYGIKAFALDTDTYAHCLAGIAGPPASPYEGGLFYVHVMVPDSHPMRPPVIRFLTRILHPNISFHGDIGLDCIRHNWSLALTLDKLLLSIQSLLTDPYTKVCMEPVIGALYQQDRDKFEELAKLWTWKYACHDYLSTTFISQLMLPDYI